jgi:hypothetical protein
MILKFGQRSSTAQNSVGMWGGRFSRAVRRFRRDIIAYTLVELMVASLALTLMCSALYACISSCFAITQVSRENLRATQIMIERMEGLRLFNWEQLVYSNWIPVLFTNYYYPLTNVGESPGTVYTGTMVVTNQGVPSTSYGQDMRVVTVTVNWTSGKVARSRSISTYAARNGLQNYIYNR